MALLEANNADPNDATNVLGAMVNRAQAEGVDLGEHVSGRIYQPTIESAQLDRLPEILQHSAFQGLTELAESRMSGKLPDWVQGATHFLAPEKTMLSLEAKEPNKYRSWRGWTGYDDDTGSYRGVVMRDNSHAFLIPGTEGKASPAATPATPTVQTASTEAPSPSLAPMQTASGAAPKENNAMFDLANLFKNFGSGLSGKTVPSPDDPDALTSMFGSLAVMGGKGEGASDGASNNLAANAMASANKMTGEEATPQMARKPFDMTQLAAILQNAGRMGTFRGPRSGGMA